MNDLSQATKIAREKWENPAERQRLYRQSKWTNSERKEG